MKELLLVTICLVTFSLGIFAQDIDYDLLLAETESAKSRDFNNFSNNLELLENSLEKLTQEQFFLYTYLKGYHLVFSGNPDEGVNKYYEALTATKNVSLRVKLLTSIINVRAFKREFIEGYKEADELLKIVELSDDASRHQALVGLAIFYNKAYDFVSAISHAETVIEQNASTRLVCFAQHLLVESKYNLGKINNVNAFNSAHQACVEAGENVAIGNTILYKARFLTENGNKDLALFSLQQNEELILSTKYSHLISDFYSSMAFLLLENGEISEAKTYANLAMSLTESIGTTEPRVKALEVLASAAEIENNLVLALELYKQFSIAEKAYLDNEKAKVLAAQQAKHQAFEKNVQIALLDKENAILKAEALTEREEKLNTQLIAVILALLTLGTFVWARKNRRMHAMLRHKAQVDQLTNIANRSHFSAESERVIAQQSVLASPVSFIIFDLDFFKHVNDNHGHLTGDWVLEHTVKAVKPLLRNSDLFGRMGGEEFAILLSGCDAQQAITIAEKCRQAIESLDCSPSGALSLKVTASFGVSDSIQCGYSFDSLYGCADDALYKSKHAGRNDVYVYEPSSTSRSSSSSTSPSASPA